MARAQPGNGGLKWTFMRILEGDVKCCQAAQAKVCSPHERLRHQIEIRHSFDHRFECRLALDTRESGSETEVGGPAKRKMTIVFSRDVEPVRLGETLRVAISGRHYSDCCLSFSNVFSAELEIARSDTSGVLARPFRTESLL